MSCKSRGVSTRLALQKTSTAGWEDEGAGMWLHWGGNQLPLPCQEGNKDKDTEFREAHPSTHIPASPTQPRISSTPKGGWVNQEHIPAGLALRGSLCPACPQVRLKQPQARCPSRAAAPLKCLLRLESKIKWGLTDTHQANLHTGFHFWL